VVGVLEPVDADVGGEVITLHLLPIAMRVTGPLTEQRRDRQGGQGLDATTRVGIVAGVKGVREAEEPDGVEFVDERGAHPCAPRQPGEDEPLLWASQRCCPADVLGEEGIALGTVFDVTRGEGEADDTETFAREAGGDSRGGGVLEAPLVSWREDDQVQAVFGAVPESHMPRCG
jgi:hypothetical protein